MNMIITHTPIALILFGWLCLGPSSANGEDVYPAGYSITSNYQLSDSLLALSDTLIISRSIVNSESFDLIGLYFSDNFPPAATIIDYNLEVGGAPVIPAFTDGQADVVVSGCDVHWWPIDDPQNPGGVHDTVGPGETVSLTVRLLFDSVGSYSFPLHTTVFRGDATSFFATEDTLYVRTFIVVDVEEGEDNKSLNPVRFELSQAYPNPFNSTVSVRYSGVSITGKSIELKITNILGQVIHEVSVRAVSDVGSLQWETPRSISSGVCFYRLECQSAAVTGKMILIK